MLGSQLGGDRGGLVAACGDVFGEHAAALVAVAATAVREWCPAVAAAGREAEPSTRGLASYAAVAPFSEAGAGVSNTGLGVGASEATGRASYTGYARPEPRGWLGGARCGW